MANENQTFKCRYCKHSHTLDHLVGALNNEREINTALDNIALYQTKLEELPTREELDEERKAYKAKKWTEKIAEFQRTIKDYSNVLICNFCWAKAKASVNIEIDHTNKIFTCDNCSNERTGKQYGLHIENKRSRGIDPRKWSVVCYDCYFNEVVPADYICPRTSDGRDTWDLSKPKFDCLCPPPERVNYLTVNGETVKEIIKGSTLLDNPKAKPRPKQPKPETTPQPDE